ncbi:hypothetical protein PM082_022465 [Marasmius tenuissimus]|nr:hypothetical protein PM082_022465 [Marasmius tenuissimus]
MLPIEIWENIIEDCQDEQGALSACSLVCRAWMPKSRQMLFKDTFLTLTDQNSSAFLNLLNDPKCTMAPYVVAVEPTASEHSPSQVNELTDTLIDKCTNLTSLKLNSEAALLPFMSLSASLTYLDLSDYLWGWDPQSSIVAGRVLNLIANFTVLEVLSLYFDSPGKAISETEPVYDHEELATSPRQSLTRLRRLHLDLVWNVFIPWFLIPDPGVLTLPAVETLELNLACWPLRVALPLLQLFLDLYSSSVRDLILHVMWESLPAVDLSRYTALRSALFKVQGPPEEGEEKNQLQNLVNIVSTCSQRVSREPLQAIVTNEDVKLANIEGVDWILDEWYFHEHYEWS